jgi:hypothetical protein
MDAHTTTHGHVRCDSVGTTGRPAWQLVVQFGKHAQFVCFGSRSAAVDVATPPAPVRLGPQLPL